MAVNPIIECFSRDLVPKYCHGLVSSVVFTAPPFLVESLPARSNRSRPCLPLHMHGEETIPTFQRSNIYIGWCLPKALTLTRLRSYKLFEVLLIVRINQCVSLCRNSHLPSARRRVSIPGGERDCSEGESSVASSIQGQNSTTWSSHNDSDVADITWRVTSTPVATQWWLIITSTSMPGTSSRSTPAPGGTS